MKLNKIGNNFCNGEETYGNAQKDREQEGAINFQPERPEVTFPDKGNRFAVDRS
jgi:hypothetical protein